MSGEDTGGPQVTRGGFPGGAYLELSVTGGRFSEREQAIVPGALRLRDLAELVAMAQAHGVDDDTTVILERSTLEGAARVRATGAGVRVPVHASSLRPAERTSTSIGAAAVEVVPDVVAMADAYERRRQDARAAHGEGWAEGFEAAAEWLRGNPGPTGIPHDPPQNPYLSDPPAHPQPVGDEVRGRRGLRQEGDLVDEVIIRPPNGFDPRVAEHRVRPGTPFHLHRTTAELRSCVVDLTILEGLEGLDTLADDPGDHGIGDIPPPGERFAELGGTIGDPSYLRPRPVRDNPQA